MESLSYTVRVNGEAHRGEAFSTWNARAAVNSPSVPVCGWTRHSGHQFFFSLATKLLYNFITKQFYTPKPVFTTQIFL